VSAGLSLRAWQREAFEQYVRTQPADFLTVATPGAGKTTFALTIAADLLHRRVVERVVVVTPTEHLKSQWAQAAARSGIALEPNLSGALGARFDGYCVTYAGLATNPVGHRVRIERSRTFVADVTAKRCDVPSAVCTTISFVETPLTVPRA